MSSITAGTTSTTTLIHSGDTTGSLVFKTNDTGSGGTTAVTIDTSQNVGIGTSSPLAILDVASSSNPAVRIRNTSTGGAGIWFGNSTSGTTTSDGANVGIDSGQQLNLWNYENTATLFATNNTERMRIDSSGNVLVQGGYLRLKSAIGDSNGLSISEDGSGNAIINNGYSNVPITFQIASSEKVRIDGSGNLLVGQTAQFGSGKTCVEFNGQSFVGASYRTTYSTSSGSGYINFRYSDNSQVGAITLNGTTGVTYGTTSDYRLKDNVQPMTGALNKVAQLKPVKYKWKSDGSDGQGFIAHELQAVVPDCVTGEKDAVDADGNPVYQGIDTSFLVATLTAALQETKALIDQQAEELSRQAATINAQSEAIASLTARIVALETA